MAQDKFEVPDWDETMSEFYTYLGEHYTITCTQALLIATNAHKSKMHLDAATGTGLGPHLLTNTLVPREGSIVVATDFSKPMLCRLEKRMKQSACFRQNEKNSFLLKLDTPQEVKIEQEYEGIHVKAYQANSMSLPFQSGIFDSYTAGFSLMMVDNPDKMIKEAYRVLRPGKLAGFSVVRQIIAILQIMRDSLIRAKLSPIPIEMDKFLELGKNPETVKTMMEEAGFKNVKYWQLDSVLPYSSGEQVFQDLFKVPFAPVNLKEEEKSSLKQAVIEEWKDKWETVDQTQLFSSRAVMLIGEKAT